MARNNTLRKDRNNTLRKDIKILIKNLDRVRSKFNPYYNGVRRKEFPLFISLAKNPEVLSDRLSLEYSKFEVARDELIDCFENNSGFKVVYKSVNVTCLDQLGISNLVAILRKIKEVKQKSLSRMARAAKKQNKRFPLYLFSKDYTIPKDLREIKFCKPH